MKPRNFFAVLSQCDVWKVAVGYVIAFRRVHGV